jgi:hypothetical protein
MEDEKAHRMAARMAYPPLSRVADMMKVFSFGRDKYLRSEYITPKGKA